LRRELRTLLVEGSPTLDRRIADHTPLISSGLVEATTLVSVARWVEDHVAADVALGAVDLVAEWDSLNAILDFVERHAPPAGAR